MVARRKLAQNGHDAPAWLERLERLEMCNPIATAAAMAAIGLSSLLFDRKEADILADHGGLDGARRAAVTYMRESHVLRLHKPHGSLTFSDRSWAAETADEVLARHAVQVELAEMGITQGKTYAGAEWCAISLFLAANARSARTVHTAHEANTLARQLLRTETIATGRRL